MIHAGCYDDIHFVLDVESGAIHVVDELAYDVAALMESGIGDAEAVCEQLAEKYGKDKVLEVYTEICGLVSEGLWFSPPAIDAETPVTYKPVVKSLCLHIAHDCNLRCSYCFAEDGTYRGERGMMTKEVAHAALDFLMEQSAGRKHLEVDFFGGEPTINFDVVKDAVAYGRELEKKFNKIIRFTLTTNAYNITDDMVEFINREMKNLVISIDGRKEVHDAVRKNAAGAGSYEKCVQNAKRLVDARGDQEYYIRGTFTAKNRDFAEDYAELAKLGFENISLEPVVTTGELELTEDMLPGLIEQYKKLGHMIEDMRARGERPCFFHFMIDFSGGPCMNKRLRGCGAGSEYAAITPQGNIYPCHQFANYPDFRMGNVLTGEFDHSIAEPFVHCNVLTKPVCRSCWAKYHCSGGCAANAYGQSGDMLTPPPVSCELEKARLEIAIGLFLKKEENGEPVWKY